MYSFEIYKSNALCPIRFYRNDSMLNDFVDEDWDCDSDLATQVFIAGEMTWVYPDPLMTTEGCIVTKFKTCIA